ncbi:unnamed protein product [Durusdinium trenchii]|uniref:Uncharacterized protein n=2 Tax=Durusdinium trenchii TaxID=1381693 RepID=A0ABP0NVK5_9DINO
MSGYNTVQDGENSLLHAAVLSGDETLVQRLITQRAELNKEEDDSTPLFKAVGLDDPAIAIALLSARAPRNR